MLSAFLLLDYNTAGSFFITPTGFGTPCGNLFYNHISLSGFAFCNPEGMLLL
jgi:hypothetical protein